MIHNIIYNIGKTTINNNGMNEERRTWCIEKTMTLRCSGRVFCQKKKNI